jgi:hypothetical protein
LQTYGNETYQRLLIEKNKSDQAQIEYNQQINRLTEEFERQLNSVRTISSKHNIDDKDESIASVEERLEEAQIKLVQYETELYTLRLKLSQKGVSDHERENLIRKNQALWKCIYDFEKKFKQY